MYALQYLYSLIFLQAPTILLPLNAAAFPQNSSGKTSENFDNVFTRRQCDNDTPPTNVSYQLVTPTWTVPPGGQGTLYAMQCNSEQQTYAHILTAGLSWSGGLFPDPTPISYLTTSYTAPVTVLCDGRTRILGSLTPVTSGIYSDFGSPPSSYLGPPPSCSIQSSDCVWLQVSYLSASSSWASRWSEDSDHFTDWPPLPPVCSINGEFNSDCGQCTIVGDDVKLLYFPPTTTPSRDMCATAPSSFTICPFGSTVSTEGFSDPFAAPAPCSYIDIVTTSTPESGPFAVINQTTFYSNRVYISFNTLYATNTCGQVGNAYANSVVAVPSSDIYSLSGYHIAYWQSAYPFNFADFIPPVPASAYLCQPYCENSDGNPAGLLGDDDMINGEYLGQYGFCSTIIDDFYRPILAVPPQVRGIDPAWKKCLLALEGLYDPPMALVPQTSVEGVTLPPGATGRPTPGGAPVSSSPILTRPNSSPLPLPTASAVVIRTTVVTSVRSGYGVTNPGSESSGPPASAGPVSPSTYGGMPLPQPLNAVLAALMSILSNSLFSSGGSASTQPQASGQDSPGGSEIANQDPPVGSEIASQDGPGGSDVTSQYLPGGSDTTSQYTPGGSGIASQDPSGSSGRLGSQLPTTPDSSSILGTASPPLSSSTISSLSSDVLPIESVTFVPTSIVTSLANAPPPTSSSASATEAAFPLHVIELFIVLILLAQ